MSQTLRLILPQWQGGNRIQYAGGTELLEWLSPASCCETIRIPVSMKTEPVQYRDGIAHKDTLLAQTNTVLNVLSEKEPDKIVVFGGDCSISLAPFAYMIGKYQDDIGVLWFDRHADISISTETSDYHAMVVTSLLGDGDKDFSSFISPKLTDERLLYVGVNDEEQFRREVCSKHTFKNIPPQDFMDDTSILMEAIRKLNVKNLLIHFDLDVIDLSSFRCQSSAAPEVYFERLKYIQPGASFKALSHALNEIDQEFNIRCISIAEFLPWDIMNLKQLLANMPLVKD